MPAPSALNLRREMPADIAAVREVETAAFGQPNEAALVDALRSLPAQIPEIVSYRTGRDLGLRDDTADVAIVGEYADEAAWRAYLAHPAHRAVVTDHVEPLVAHRQSVQFHD